MARGLASNEVEGVSDMACGKRWYVDVDCEERRLQRRSEDEGGMRGELET